MAIELNSVKTYQEHLTILPNVDKGIARIRKLLCWPEDNEPSDLTSCLPCFYEYIAFHNGVALPFFKVLHVILTNHITSLYAYLNDNCNEPASFLTHDEAYDFLCALGHADTRSIIDHYALLPSNVYTEVINAIHTQDKAAFSAVLKGTDCQDLMGVLWTMRYLLYGIQTEKDVRVIKRGKRIKFENLWLTDTGLSSFFRNIPKEVEEQFVEERIKLLCGFETKNKARRQRIGWQQHGSEVIAQAKPCTHYVDGERIPWKLFLSEHEKKSATSTVLSSITYNCKLKTYKILLSAFRSHKDAIGKRFGSIGGKSFAAAIELRWKNEDWEYVELEYQDFQDFITLTLQQMRSVYLSVEEFLNDADKDLLNWIVSLYTDVDRQQGIQAEEHKEVIHEGQAIDGDYNTIPKREWYVTVLNSKLKGNTNEEKNIEMGRCLSLLYDELTKEGSNLIDTATPKPLFIYRFSGKGESYPLTTKIKWRGKNVLLGHIVRCLLSDKKNAPEDMGIASEFFESKSGNTINLASAKQVPVNDYEKERGNLDPNFVEAVELLRRCGFVNVELTSKRR